jgi:hypothetical protein
LSRAAASSLRRYKILSEYLLHALDETLHSLAATGIDYAVGSFCSSTVTALSRGVRVDSGAAIDHHVSTQL